MVSSLFILICGYSKNWTRTPPAFSTKVLNIYTGHWKLFLCDWSNHYWQNVRVSQQWIELLNSNQFACWGPMRLIIMTPGEFELQTINTGFNYRLILSLNNIYLLSILIHVRKQSLNKEGLWNHVSIWKRSSQIKTFIKMHHLSFTQTVT